MNIGMLWRMGQGELGTAIREAAAYYQRKYGRSANVAYVNPRVMGKETRVDGIAVIPAKQIQMGCVWMGVDDDHRGR